MSAPKRRRPAGRSRHDGVKLIMDGLRRIVRELRLSARAAEQKAGVTGAQHFVLQSLVDMPAASLNELAERTLTDQSSVSVVVSRLVAQKFVTRKVSREDARRVELDVTAAGKRLLERCPEPTQAKLLAGLDAMTSGELAALNRGMAALVREMGIGGEPPRMLFSDDEPKRSPRRPKKATIS